MAKKKTVAKKSSAKSKPVKKAASKSKSVGKAKPTKSSAKKTNVKVVSKSNTKVAAKSLPKTNGVSKTLPKKTVTTKSSAKQIAASDINGGLQNFKQRNNGSENEKGLNPQTYSMLRQDIISTLWKYDEITFDELAAAMEKIHGRNFVTDSLKYLKQVMSDLMNIDLIEKVEQGPNRQAYRIRQRLGEQ